MKYIEHHILRTYRPRPSIRTSCGDKIMQTKRHKTNESHTITKMGFHWWCKIIIITRFPPSFVIKARTWRGHGNYPHRLVRLATFLLLLPSDKLTLELFPVWCYFQPELQVDQHQGRFDSAEIRRASMSRADQCKLGEQARHWRWV